MADSAAAFVRVFYSVEAPREIASGLAAVDSLVAERPALFVPALRGALERDVADRAAADGEIVGLDFLPFLGTQDPCERYEVARAQSPDAASPGEVRVPVYAVCGGNPASEPAVIVAVRRAPDGWTISNVHFPQLATDLLAVLERD